MPIDRASVTDLHQLLHDRFGFSSFRGVQQAVVDRAIAGQHTLAVMPTGAGKSLCYQLPALAREGTALVVSPLIALMHDQIRSAEALGIQAASLTSADSDREQVIARFEAGALDLLYVAPERATTEGFRRLAASVPLALIAIDEAHCVSEWGHDFRPEYRQLAKLRALLPEVPVMALTATATSRVRTDVITHLKLHDPATFVASFNRPNLTYKVIPKDQPIKQIIDFVRKREHESGIIYCASRATAERVADSLAGRDF
jgi:ATP-dependent DNA helicase RecQ